MVWRWRRDSDLDHNIHAHLDLLAAEHERRGLSPQAAREAARREFGGVEQMKERYRDQRGWRWVDDLVRDVRYAVRGLLRSPGFAVVAIVTLALGIGSTTAIFSVVNTVLIRPLPYPDVDRLGEIVENIPATETPDGEPDQRTIALSVRDLTELRSRSRTLADAGIRTLFFVTVAGSNGTVRMEGLRASPAILQMLGVRAHRGRLLDRGDEDAAASAVVVLSYGAWQQYFGAREEIIGQPVSLANPITFEAQTYTVVGIMPSSFDSGQTQFWAALPFSSEERPPRGGMRVRLAPGVSPQAAADEVGAIVSAMRGDSPAPAPPGGSTMPRFEFIGEQAAIVEPVRPALIALLYAVGFVLLIACANVANLILARAAARRRELSVRLALGAGRWRVVRQLVTESVLLALVGGAAGVALAAAGIGLLRTMAATLPRMDLGIQLPFPRLIEIGLDRSMLLFALVAALVTGILSGLIPALRYSRSTRVEATRTRTQNTLVVAQVAMALTLLVGGGLMIRSFALLAGTELGFDPGGVLTFQVGLTSGRYTTQASQVSFAEALAAQLRALPGVSGAAYGRQVPFIAIEESSSFRRTPEPPARFGPGFVDTRLVNRDYLDVLGIPIVMGRGFRESDGAGQARVLVINEALARQEFPAGDAVGQLVFAGRDTTPWQIIGVVEDVRQNGQDRDARPQMFADFRQWPEANGMGFTFLGAYYALRTERDSASIVPDIRAAAQAIDAGAGVFNVAPMDDIVDNRVSRPRMYTVLVSLFSALAVLLAAVGLHGVMSWAVTQQTHDIGIRMALGAQRGQVLRLVLRNGVGLAGIGIVIGLTAAAALTRYLERLLYGVTPLDPLTFAGVTILFVAVAALAALVPARRATSINPIVALRVE